MTTPASTDAALHARFAEVFEQIGEGAIEREQGRGLAHEAVRQLKAAGFKVIDVGNLSLADVSATTVYYTDADGEHATADAVGKNLGAPVEPRIPAIANEPSGVIVVVMG